MLNLTRLHLGIAHESQFQGLGINPPSQVQGGRDGLLSLLRCMSRRVALRDVSLLHADLVAIRGIADTPGRSAACRRDVNDPEQICRTGDQNAWRGLRTLARRAAQAQSRRSGRASRGSSGQRVASDATAPNSLDSGGVNGAEHTHMSEHPDRYSYNRGPGS